MRKRFIVAIEALALIAAACSDNDDWSSDAEVADTTAAPAAIDAAAPDDDATPTSGAAHIYHFPPGAIWRAHLRP